MNTLLKKAGLGVALAATALTGAVPAEAQRYRGGGYGGYHGGGYHGGYRGGYRGGYDRGGTAVVAGIAGLAIGAAIASNNRDRYYDRGYYNRGYYDDGYYAYDRGPRYRCYVERRYDPYYGRNVRVRICR